MAGVKGKRKLVIREQPEEKEKDVRRYLADQILSGRTDEALGRLYAAWANCSACPMAEDCYRHTADNYAVRHCAFMARRLLSGVDADIIKEQGAHDGKPI